MSIEGAADGLHARLDAQQVVHERGLGEGDRHIAHREAEALRATFGEDRPVMNAERAQKFGAAALQEAQIGRVIDDAGEIRVLIIDAEVETMRHRGSGARAAGLSAAAKVPWGLAWAERYLSIRRKSSAYRLPGRAHAPRMRSGAALAREGFEDGGISGSKKAR